MLYIYIIVFGIFLFLVYTYFGAFFSCIS